MHNERKKEKVNVTNQRISISEKKSFLLKPTLFPLFRCDYASRKEVVSVRRIVRPPVRPSVNPYVPCYFLTKNMAVFEGNKSSNDINISGKRKSEKKKPGEIPISLSTRRSESGLPLPIKCLRGFGVSRESLTRPTTQSKSRE